MDEDFGMFGDESLFEREDDFNVWEERQIDLDRDAGEGREYEDAGESLQDEIEVEMMAEGIGE